MKTNSVWAGMLLEAIAILITLRFFVFSTPPLIPTVLVLVAGQGILLYSVHCLSHYVVGRLLGIRFRSLLVARSALKKSSSRIIRIIGQNAVTPILIIDRTSLAKATPLRRKAMFYAGVTGSITVPFLVAAYAASTGDPVSTGATLLVAMGYLTFNFFYSPRTGDVYRARLLGAVSAQGR